LEFPEPIEKALTHKLMGPEQALVMLQDQWHWKIPTPEDAFERLNITPAKEEPEILPPDLTSEPIVEMKVKNEMLEQEMMESIKVSNRLKNEKIIFYTDLTRKLKEI